MAYEIPGFSWTLPAAANFSNKATTGQFRFVGLDTGEAAAPDPGGEVLGIRQNLPIAGQGTTIVSSGISMIEAGAVIAQDAHITCDDEGKAVTALPGDLSHGRALVAAGAEDVVIPVFMQPNRAGWQSAGSGGVASTILSIPIQLAGVTTADIVTGLTPGFGGRILWDAFCVTVPVTTGGDGATLNLEIGTTDVTGGAIVLTSANCTPLGAVIAGTAITAENAFDSADTISVEASSVTAFAEGAGVLLVGIQA